MSPASPVTGIVASSVSVAQVQPVAQSVGSSVTGSSVTGSSVTGSAPVPQGSEQSHSSSANSYQSPLLNAQAFHGLIASPSRLKQFLKLIFFLCPSAIHP